MSALPEVHELSAIVEQILGTSGGPPVMYEVAGDELVAETFEEGILLGGPYEAVHVAHELVHWHMLGSWDALPHGAEEGLAVLISTYVCHLFAWYGPYEPGDESVFEWTTERWLADATLETYSQAARSLLAIGIPETFAHYGVPVSPGIQEMVETYCVRAKQECLGSAPPSDLPEPLSVVAPAKGE